MGHKSAAAHAAIIHLSSPVFSFLSWYVCVGGGGGLVIKSCPTLVTPWTGARQAPLFMGFSREEY